MHKSIKKGLLTVSTLAVFAAVGATGYLGSMTSRACFGSDLQIPDLTNDPHFSSSYEEARLKFTNAVESRDQSVTSIQNPVAGPNGEALTLDYSTFGPKEAENLLVIVSGSHGVEGFAGSGIQTSLISSGRLDDLPANTRVLLVHALNPYGMAHLRRVNEDNVDLNRNFLDHSNLPPENEAYAELAQYIAPKSLSFFSDVRSWANMLGYRAIKGDAAARKALTTGQYAYNDGLFFGGNKETWSNTTLRTLLADQVAGAKRTVVIDIHTGLGEFGAIETIMNSAETAPEVITAKAIWGDTVRTTANGESVSQHLSGTMKLGLQEMFKGQDITVAAVEFGTVPGLDVVKALRARNWLHHHGGPDNPRADEIKACILAAFYPNSPEWRATILDKGMHSVEQVFEYFASS